MINCAKNCWRFLYFSLGQVSFKLNLFLIISGERKDTLKKWCSWPKMKIRSDFNSPINNVSCWPRHWQLLRLSLISGVLVHMKMKHKTNKMELYSWVEDPTLPRAWGVQKCPTTKYPPGLRAMFCMAPSRKRNRFLEKWQTGAKNPSWYII